MSQRVLLIPLLLVAMACSSKNEPVFVVGEETPIREAPSGEAVPSGWGTLRGRFVFEGEIPPREPIDIGEHPHAQTCHAGELFLETWVINAKNRGVANCVVYLKAPKGSALPQQPPGRKTWPDRVVLDQPKCQFVPHVSVLFPEFYDSATQQWVRTGQEWVAKNDSPVRHTVDTEGSNTINPFHSQVLSAKAGAQAPQQAVDIHADRVPIEIRCKYHKWMSAYAFAFDHPYAAVTNADGEFVIQNAPAGIPVELHVWHEAAKIRWQNPTPTVTIPIDGELVRDGIATQVVVK